MVNDVQSVAPAFWPACHGLATRALKFLFAHTAHDLLTLPALKILNEQQLSTYRCGSETLTQNFVRSGGVVFVLRGRHQGGTCSA